MSTRAITLFLLFTIGVQFSFSQEESIDTVFLPVENLWGIGDYTNEVMTGDWTFYRRDWTKHSEGKFFNRYPIGRWINFKRSGDTSNIISYNALGVKTGFFKSFSYNSKTKKTMNFVNGVKEGPFFREKFDGRIIERGHYSKDKRHKENVYYNYNDSTARYATYYYGKIIGYSKTISMRTGNIVLEGEYDKAGYQAGHWKAYFEDGALQSEGEFQKSAGEGYWKYYYHSGKIQNDGYYKDGLHDGKWTWFDEEKGFVKLISHYKKGERHGDWIWYNEDGTILAQEEFNMGVRLGDSTNIAIDTINMAEPDSIQQ